MYIYTYFIIGDDSISKNKNNQFTFKWYHAKNFVEIPHGSCKVTPYPAITFVRVGNDTFRVFRINGCSWYRCFV